MSEEDRLFKTLSLEYYTADDPLPTDLILKLQKFFRNEPLPIIQDKTSIASPERNQFSIALYNPNDKTSLYSNNRCFALLTVIYLKAVDLLKLSSYEQIFVNNIKEQLSLKGTLTFNQFKQISQIRNRLEGIPNVGPKCQPPSKRTLWNTFYK